MENVIMQTAALYALEIIKTLILTLVGVAGTWLLAQTGKNKHLANIHSALGEVGAAVTVVVAKLQKKFVENWKQINEYGKLTEEYIKRLNKTLIDEVMKNLSDPAIQLLKGAKIDLEEYILSMGEKAVTQLTK